MKTTILLLLAIALLAMAVPALAEPQPAARVVAQSGEAWAEANGARRTLALRANIFEGDNIITGASGRVQVMFRDQTLFTLGPNSRIGVTQYMRNNAMRAEFQLQQGRIRMISGQIVRQNPDNFRMNTPTACIGIRGTMTGHEIENGSEKHFVLDIAAGHDVIVFEQDNPADYRLLTEDHTVVEIGADGAVGEVRDMSSEEIREMDEATTIPAAELSADGSVPGAASGDATAADGADATATADGTAGDNTLAAGAVTGDATITTAGADATTGFVANATTDLTTTTTTATTNTTTATTPADIYTHGIGSTILVGPTGAAAATYRQSTVEALGSSTTFGQRGGSGAIAATLDANDNPTATSIDYNGSAWSGSQAAVYTPAGEYAVAGTPYMEWGSWDMSSPAYQYNLTGGANPGNYTLSRGYEVMGQLTPAADLAALRSNNTSATYSGAASGTYYYSTAAAQNISGTFSTDINFGTDQVSNVNLNFASPGITMSTSGFAGVLNANGTFEITSPLTITTPGGGAASGSVAGATYGSDAAAVGGVWEASTASERATGEFHGLR